MNTKIEIQPCPYTDSTLFQFILTEYIRAQHELNSLAQLFNRYAETFDSAFQNDILQKLAYTAKQFSGLSLNLSPLQFHHQDRGALAKFVNYTHQFQQDVQQRELQKIKKLANKSLQLSFELSNIPQNSHFLKQFGKSLDKIIKTLNSLKEPLIKLISQFSDDENVILFLVMYQLPLDNIFGKSFTANQLQTMHTSVQQCAKFLLKSYARRSFDKLLPVISQKIADLECVL